MPLNIYFIDILLWSFVYRTAQRKWELLWPHRTGAILTAAAQDYLGLGFAAKWWIVFCRVLCGSDAYNSYPKIDACRLSARGDPARRAQFKVWDSWIQSEISYFLIHSKWGMTGTPSTPITDTGIYIHRCTLHRVGTFLVFERCVYSCCLLWFPFWLKSYSLFTTSIATPSHFHRAV